MRRFNSGWFGESHRHYLASKGVVTKYFSRFKTRRELDSGAVEYVNPEGKKIIYAPGFQKVIHEKGSLPSPDDVAYVYDELAPELTPADTVLITKQGLARTHAQLKLAESLSKDEYEKEYLKGVIASRPSSSFLTKMYKKDLADLENAQNEGRFKQLVGEELKDLKHTAGQHAGNDLLNDKIMILPTNSDFNTKRATIIHEQGHAVDFNLGDNRSTSLGGPDSEWKFDRATAPTDYGTVSPMEDFAETFTLGITPSDGAKSVRWTAREREGAQSHADLAARFANEGGKGSQFWKRQSERNAEKLSNIVAAEGEFPERINWMEKNVAGWSAPSSRERDEAARSPKVLAADALVKSGVNVEQGKFMVRK